MVNLAFDGAVALFAVSFLLCEAKKDAAAIAHAARSQIYNLRFTRCFAAPEAPLKELPSANACRLRPFGWRTKPRNEVHRTPLKNIKEVR